MVKTKNKVDKKKVETKTEDNHLPINQPGFFSGPGEEPEKTEKAKKFNELKATVEKQTKSKPADKIEVSISHEFHGSEKTEDKAPAKDKAELIEETMEEEQHIRNLFKQVTITDLQNPCYMEMDAYIDEVVLGIATGCFIVGPGGIGKSYRAIAKCNKVDYEYLDSFTTPAAFFIFLYENRNKKVVILDDLHALMKDLKVLAMLKGATGPIGDTRICTYATTKPLQDEKGNYVPRNFEMKAGLVILSNELKRGNPHLEAVLSRIQHCVVEVSREELLKIMEQVAEKDYGDLTKSERMEVLDYLIDHTSPLTDDLNLRTLIKCFQHRMLSKETGNKNKWMELIDLSIGKEDPDLICIQELLINKTLLDENARIKQFILKTGKSKSTYYRLKDRLSSKVKVAG